MEWCFHDLGAADLTLMSLGVPNQHDIFEIKDIILNEDND